MAIAQEQDGTLQPPVYKRPKDKMSEIIGEFGRWQFTKILIVFIIGVPGKEILGSFCFAFTLGPLPCLCNCKKCCNTLTT
jgi:hypothetical protein